NDGVDEEVRLRSRMLCVFLVHRSEPLSVRSCYCETAGLRPDKPCPFRPVRAAQQYGNGPAKWRRKPGSSLPLYVMSFQRSDRKIAMQLVRSYFSCCPQLLST